MPCAFAQAPSISGHGVVNAASWSETISPGSLIAIFGSNLAAGQASASAPLPLTLAGTSVTINGVAAPLSFVSPGQINAQAPWSLTAPDRNIIAVTLAVTTAAGSASIQTGLASAAPGFFTADASGCGQAAALNIHPDGAVSVNSPSNSAAPGDYVALFGTGFGVPAQHLDDGTAAPGSAPLSATPGLTLDGTVVAPLAYAGLAPGLPGVDQINFEVPSTTRNGCAVPVTGNQGLGGSKVTISVQKGRGQCTDPPIQSYGLIGLNSLAGSVNLESFHASFPAGPNVTPGEPEKVVYAPDEASDTGAIRVELSAFPFQQRSCPVPGYTNLSAGSIRVSPPSGDPVTFAPLSDGTGGVVYAGNLPAGFVQPGVYTITGTTAANVSLNTKMTVGSPIQLETSFPPGTEISSSEPLTIRWTGGDPDSVVRMSITSSSSVGGSASSYTYAHTADGSLTIPPVCSGGTPSQPGKVCTFGPSGSSSASISIQVMPDPTKKPSIAVPGITGPVFLSWSYAYSFPFLVLTQ
ncbi:MAG TPA: hypothetical protein VHC72_12375 [Bryobacteraceae bacterium]|nr:hypothetical protein [Bryobacteraceae bacterium]